MNYENEIWKDIIIEKNGILYDFSGMYQVSNYGRVKSLDRVDTRGNKIKGKIMKPYLNARGYLSVSLCKDGKHKGFSVHRLVATAFIPNPDNLPQVNHKSELKTDNIWTNLEWCTAKYNINYGTANERRAEKHKGKHISEEHRQKISESKKGKPRSTEISEKCKRRIKETNSKKVICIETKQVFDSVTLAKEWSGKGNIYDCCKGKRSTAGGYHWQYLDDYKREQRMQSDINNSMAA